MGRPAGTAIAAAAALAALLAALAPVPGRAARLGPVAVSAAAVSSHSPICAVFGHASAPSGLLEVPSRRLGRGHHLHPPAAYTRMDVHEELRALAQETATDNHPGPATMLHIISHLYRLVGMNVAELGAGDVDQVIAVLEDLLWAKKQGKNSRAYALRTMAAVSCSGATMEAHLRRMLKCWDAAIWRWTPLQVPVLSSAWNALESFAQSDAASAEVLEQVVHGMVGLLDTDGYTRPSSLHAMRVLKMVVASHGADLRTIRLATDAWAPLATRCSVACIAPAHDIFMLAARRLTMDPRFSDRPSDRAELVGRSFVLAGRGPSSAAVCPDVLDAFAEVSPRIFAAEANLKAAGLPLDVVGFIGDFAEPRGAAEAYRETIGTCTDLALADQEVGRRIASSLWGAICAPSTDVGLPAAQGFAKVADVDPGLWRYIGALDLTRVGRCLQVPRAVAPATMLAQEVAAILEGTWAHMRHRPRWSRNLLRPSVRELCRGLERHLDLVADVPGTVDAAAVAARFAAVCEAIGGKPRRPTAPRATAPAPPPAPAARIVGGARRPWGPRLRHRRGPGLQQAHARKV